MTENSQFDSMDATSGGRTPSRWPKSTGMVVQLVVVALIAILLGIFVFPM